MTHNERPSMTCLDCSHYLVMESSACPECGRTFDPADPETFQRVLHDPMRIARLPMAEGVVACMALEQAGIHAVVEEEMGGIIGHIDLPRGSVWVERADERAAITTLSELATRRQHSKPWTCPQCREAIEAQFDVCWSCGAERG